MASTAVVACSDDVVAAVDRIAAVVEAFGHPTRLRIVAWAYVHPNDRVSASRLAEAFDDHISAMSYHVRRLRDDGHLRTAGQQRVRGAVERFYVLTPAARGLLASGVQAIVRSVT